MGFQEIVPLNTSAILTKNNAEVIKMWNQLVLAALNKDRQPEE